MKPSKYQLAIQRAFDLTNKNLTINAVAGSGKTTTLLMLLNSVPKNKSCLFLAFNKAIVEELTRRVKPREGLEIMTLHSCGWAAILRRFGYKSKMKENKALGKVEKALKSFPDIPAKKRGWFFYMVPKMLDLMRCNLTPPVDEEIIKLADYHDLMIDETVDVKVIKKAFELSVKDITQFDFTDMIFYPAVDKVCKLKKYDYVFCDESQDFSAAQQQLISLSLARLGRLICVGDEKQAIYGFAGADADSYQNLPSINGKSFRLPLSVSYRCSKAVILEAQKIVPYIRPYEQAQQGRVDNQASLQTLKQGDWIVCRNLKPLVATYLWLMKNKIKSKIKGVEIGEGLIQMIQKIDAKTIPQLHDRLENEVDKLYNKLADKGVSKPNTHPKMDLLRQKIDVLTCLMWEVETVDKLIRLLKSIFSDEVEGIMLMTIHKSKGLENDRIFFLCPELIPSKYATQPWQFEQERNLKYVAITRAKSELLYVTGEQFKLDIETDLIL
jgi:superfamily I DNA/RNA helicase